MHYYNDNDPKIAAWLRELIAQGQLPVGDVDERSIHDVEPKDLEGYTQCHFFAGIGGWSLALRLAGWPDDRPVWTGSCPCQPFSNAGRRKGVDDDRHLAPVWLELVRQCAPPVVFGEQVASKAGRVWLADLRAEMEALGYAVGAADLCAAGIGAPHIRQRLWFGACRLADGGHAQRERGPEAGGLVAQDPAERIENTDKHQSRRGACRLADGDLTGLEGRQERRNGADQRTAGTAGMAGGLADNNSRRFPEGGQTATPARHRNSFESDGSLGERSGAPHAFWRAADWLHCRDGKWRPAEPGTFPLADGVPARVVRLRGYGNAIVPPLAAEFVSAFAESMNETS